MKNIFKLSLLIISLSFLYNCGYMQTDCTTVGADRDAYRLCTANQGSKISQYELGVEAYDSQDYKTALKWLKRAAMPRSAQNYAYMPPVDDRPYGNLRSGPTIPEKQARLLPGHKGAQNMLVRMYSEGIGVKANQSLARYYNELN